MLSSFRSVARAKSFLPAVRQVGVRPFSDMFCYQCEQTQDGKGCTAIGVCGKTPEVAAMQDLLIETLKDISSYAHVARTANGAADKKIDEFVLKAMFATLTNVNFDEHRFQDYLGQAETHRANAYKLMKDNAGSMELPAFAATNYGSMTVKELVNEGHKFGVESRKGSFGDDIAGLQELLMYGVKGLSAYSEHAYNLGQERDSIFAFVHEALHFIKNDPRNKDANELLGMALRAGETNLQAMEALDAGATGRYGHPVPTQVNTSTVEGKAILVSGHELTDLEEILKLTDGTGVNVYTHGELLPAHGYPELKKYKHLVGNYGSAWQNQKFEFSRFPGPIVVTTNCIIEPRKSYKDRVYTSGVAGWPGVKHLNTEESFEKLVAHAKDLPGFTETEQPKPITVGFGRNAVMSVAGDVIQAIKDGKIKHFYLIGGCDGSEGERSYFRDLAMSLPEDNVILTLGCGKYRFNKMQFGTVPGTGIPRLLDIGQCNDAYSAIQIASALSTALDTPVNDLPLSFAVSWFEQKAVAVLLTLLKLGIKNIHLGPALPAFLTPNTLGVVVNAFDLKPIGDPRKDFNL